MSMNRPGFEEASGDGRVMILRDWSRPFSDIHCLESIAVLLPLAQVSRPAHPCLSDACWGCTDQAAGSSSLSAAAAACVACTLPGV